MKQDWLAILNGEAYEKVKLTRIADVGAIAAGATSQVNHRWEFSGRLYFVMATSVGDGTDAGMASLAVKISIGGGQEALFLAGSSEDYIAFSLLAPKYTAPAPFVRRVKTGDIWSVTFKNYHTANPYTPQLGFWADRSSRDAA